MTMFITVATAMEQFQQIEVVNGALLARCMDLPTRPECSISSPSDRPAYDLREVTASYVSDSVGTRQGRPGPAGLDPGGMFSYRINGVYGSGDGFVDESHQRRVLGDVGIDVRPWAARRGWS